MHSYLLVLHDEGGLNIYKIPVGVSGNEKKHLHVCLNTGYFSNLLNYLSQHVQNQKAIETKLNTYKPIYFNKFKYVGKGFKLIFKKKKKLFNCIFGYSHVY